MAEHRRSMQALRRAAAKAATEATVTMAARPAALEPPVDNVRSLAEARARRAGHPAGSARAQ
jgi:hypothetical protein